MRTIKLIMALSILPIINNSYASDGHSHDTKQKQDDSNNKILKTQLIDKYGQTEVERVSAIGDAIIDIADKGFVPSMSGPNSYNEEVFEQEKPFSDLKSMIKFGLISSMQLETLEHVLGKIDNLKKLHNNYLYDYVLDSILSGYDGLLRFTDFTETDDEKLQEISNIISEILSDTTNSMIAWQNKNGDINKDEYISQIRRRSTLIASKLPETLKESFRQTEFYRNNSDDIDNWSFERF